MKWWTSRKPPVEATVKVVAITRVLDEADIVEAFVRHTACYASHHVFFDNGSRDETVAILTKLKEEGFGITVFQNKSVSYNEVNFNTFMFNYAARAQGADWVLCLDADEFIDDRALEGGLIEKLKRLASAEPGIECLRMELIEYRCTAEDDTEETIVPLRIKSRRDPFGVTKVFLHKALATPDVSVGGGNHFALRHGRVVDSRTEPRLKLAHFPERSCTQLAAKWIKGWAKVLAAGPDVVALGASNHYREPFAILRDEPHLLLRDPGFLRLRQNQPLTVDPIVYRGDALRYTPVGDPAMHAARTLIGYIEDLATRHGRLVAESPDARLKVERWNAEVEPIL